MTEHRGRSRSHRAADRRVRETAHVEDDRGHRDRIAAGRHGGHHHIPAQPPILPTMVPPPLVPPVQGWPPTLTKVELLWKAMHPTTYTGIARTRASPSHAGTLRPINTRIAGAGVMRAAMMRKCSTVRQHYRLRRHTDMPNGNRNNYGNHNDGPYPTSRATRWAWLTIPTKDSRCQDLAPALAARRARGKLH